MKYKQFKTLFIEPNYYPGYLPEWLSGCPEGTNIITYLDLCYLHGGGWRPFQGFTLQEDDSLLYPGDPALPVQASFQCGDDIIHMYAHAWVCIVRPDTSYEVCRMD